MKCEECQLLIEQYFDGELSVPGLDLVTGHLSACGSCAQAYQMLEREQDFYQRNESEIEASPAFWSNVFAEMADDRPVPIHSAKYSLKDRFARSLRMIGGVRISLVSSVLIVLIAIGVTADVMKYHYSGNTLTSAVDSSKQIGTGVYPAISPSGSGGQSRPKENGESDKAEDVVRGAPPMHANSPHVITNRVKSVGGRETGRESRRAFAVQTRQGPEELVREAEQKYLAAIALLARDANRRRSHLDSETQSQFNRTMAAIDRAIAGARGVARVRPDDPVAVQYMLTAYSKKVDLLRQMMGEE